MRAAGRLTALVAWSGCFASAVDTCPGTIHVKGYGPVVLSNALWDVPGKPAGTVTVDAGSVLPGMKGRTYFTKSCSNATYGPALYADVPLLDQTLRYTTDLSGAGCGCNAALYLTNLQQNTELSGCSDYYCDANSVCGVGCAEIDLQEANMQSWRSTLHLWDDGSGIGVGYGGGGPHWNGPRDWSSADYGPDATCIKTTKPFEVALSFPTDLLGQLMVMTVELSQDGCKLSASVGQEGYHYKDRAGMSELTVALKTGMTPIISYWSAPDMLWMDGQGADGAGPCKRDDPDACGKSVKFYDFSVGPIGASARPGARQQLV